MERLPEKYRTGSVLVDSGDLFFYFNVFLLSFSGFCLLYILLNILFKRCNYFFSKEDLATKSEDDKFWRVQGWVLITHHFLAVTLSIRTLYSSCLTGDSDEEPRWQWIRSDECFAMVSPRFATIVLMSIGFLSFDYILMRMCLQNQKPKVVKQTFVHHLVAICGFLTAIISGYSFPGIACLGLLSEISSIFLAFNDQMKHKGTSMLLFLNSLGFFISYTVIRMIGFPICLYLMSWSVYTFHSQVSYLRLFCMLVSTLQGVLITLLNFYWYYFVVKKLIRTVNEMKAKNNSDDDFQRANGEGNGASGSRKRANLDDDYCMD